MLRALSRRFTVLCLNFRLLFPAYRILDNDICKVFALQLRR